MGAALRSERREPLPARAGGCLRLRLLSPHPGSLSLALSPHLHILGAAKQGQSRRVSARAPNPSAVVLTSGAVSHPPPRSRLGGPGRAGLGRRAGGQGVPARTERGWANAPAVSPSRPGARPAPSSTFLVGVASWVFYSKSRLANIGRSFPMLFMCMCLYV